MSESPRGGNPKRDKPMPDAPHAGSVLFQMTLMSSATSMSAVINATYHLYSEPSMQGSPPYHAPIKGRSKALAKKMRYRRLERHPFMSSSSRLRSLRSLRAVKARYAIATAAIAATITSTGAKMSRAAMTDTIPSDTNRAQDTPCAPYSAACVPQGARAPRPARRAGTNTPYRAYCGFSIADCAAPSTELRKPQSDGEQMCAPARELAPCRRVQWFGTYPSRLREHHDR